MKKAFLIILSVIILQEAFHANAFKLVDSETLTALPLASITDHSGNVVEITDKTGEIPLLPEDSYPITFNYMGYAPLQLLKPAENDVKMIYQDYELPEIVIIPGNRPLLYLTGYMREVTSILGSSDSVTLYKESIVDFLVPVEKSKVKGWSKPRELASKTYVRMTNSTGLDSVSTNHEYEYMLWANRYSLIPSPTKIPQRIKDTDFACDTIMGKYYPKIIWWKNGDVTRRNGDALANEKNHIISPSAFKLFGLTTDFTELSINYVFNTPDEDFIRPTNLKQVSMTIDILAKGKVFKKYFDSTSPVNVRTYVELYLTDREFLSDEEGKAIKKNAPVFKTSEIEAPENAADLHSGIKQIINRVNTLQ